jgi:hypothetical protein
VVNNRVQVMDEVVHVTAEMIQNQNFGRIKKKKEQRILTYIGDSKIPGEKGLFASTDLAASLPLCEYGGVLLSKR